MEKTKPKYAIIRFAGLKNECEIVDINRVFRYENKSFIPFKKWKFNRYEWFYVEADCDEQHCKKKKQVPHVHHYKSYLIAVSGKFLREKFLSHFFFNNLPIFIL